MVALLVALGSPAFFVLAAVLGYRYEGAESTTVYIVYSLTLAALGVWIAVFDLVQHGRRYPVTAWMAGTLPVLIGAWFLAEVSGGIAQSVAWPLFRNFLVWAMPALYVGMYIGRSGHWRSVHRLLDALMVFLSAGSLSALVSFLLEGWAARGIGGATYQTLSYVSALAFGLNLYLLRSRAAQGGHPVVRTKIYRLVCVALLPVQLFAAVASGGRGGVVLIGVYVLFELVRRRSAGGRLRSAVVVAVVAAMAVVLLQIAMPNTVVGAGYDRVFAYVTSGGIDWSGTSGRDVVYSRALGLIDERLWFGYGPFGFIEGISPYAYPHNILLELLLAWGVVGFTGVVMLSTPLVRRYFTVKRGDSVFGGLGVLATYQIVMLMFSGTYLAAPTLWFAAGVVIASAVPETVTGSSFGGLSEQAREERGQ